MHRQLLGGGGQLAVIHHLPDHPPGLRLLGADFLAQQGQAHRPGATRQAWQ
ncbi:hypothetical protein D3C78_1903730 [compost metagenome]